MVQTTSGSSQTGMAVSQLQEAPPSPVESTTRQVDSPQSRSSASAHPCSEPLMETSISRRLGGATGGACAGGGSGGGISAQPGRSAARTRASNAEQRHDEAVRRAMVLHV